MWGTTKKIGPDKFSHFDVIGFKQAIGFKMSHLLSFKLLKFWVFLTEKYQTMIILDLAKSDNCNVLASF